MTMSAIIRRGLTSNGSTRRIALPGEPPKRSKFGNVRAVGGLGELYDSRAERQYAFTLESKRISGSVDRWSWGPRFVLQDDPLITYRPDFIVWPRVGSMYAVDVKGHASRDFSLRVRLWKARYPGVQLVLIKNGAEVPA